MGRSCGRSARHSENTRLPPETRPEITTQISAAKGGFDSFGLGQSIVRGIEFAGYETPRPIQTETIPSVLEGRDVLGLAQTGTGKTAAFALPILESLMARRTPGPSVLILAPTRELASQINAEFTTLGQFTPVRSTTVYGGVSIKRHIQALRARPNIVVACPGRLLDLYRQNSINLNGISTLVIDEADQMFDMGFMPDVRAIIDLVSSNRQTLLFSATMPKEIRHLANRILKNPKVVDLGNSKIVSTIEHELYPVAQQRKFNLLQFLISDKDFKSAIIFMRTKHRALRTARQLQNGGYNAVALQGNMSQVQRDRAMQGFRDGKYKILVATDIAARGIDVANISHVINFDFPNTPDSYVHRIGRTGRSEQSGRAFTFVTPDDEDAVRALERKLGRKVNRCVLPDYTKNGARPVAASATQSKPGQQSESALEAARERLNQRDPGQRPGRKPKTHGGYQPTRGKQARSRHRKHAVRSQ